jgi:hypothetical protein
MDYARRLGMSSRETDAALKKHKGDLRNYVRTLKDRYDLACKRLESEHRKREFSQWSALSQAKHKGEKEEQYDKILQQRARLSLEVRFQSVLSKARLYDSRAKSPSLGGNGGANSDSPLGPPGTFTGQPPTIDLEDSLRVIEKHIERMEARVDAFLGLCPPVSLTEKEKGELLDQLAGMHSKVVSESFPELGSQRTVEKHRLDRATMRGVEVSPSTGEVKT